MVNEWLQGFGLATERYTKTELREGKKTPDYKVLKEGLLQFFCEVKAVVGSIELETDTTPNQLTGDIHDAFKKFKGINPDRILPNVLAFVNKKGAAGVDYLEDVLTGQWFMENGEAYPFYVYYSEGRIRDEKAAIDLYLWFEGGDNVKFRFTGVVKSHLEHLCRLFGIEPSNVGRIA